MRIRRASASHVSGVGRPGSLAQDVSRRTHAMLIRDRPVAAGLAMKTQVDSAWGVTFANPGEVMPISPPGRAYGVPREPGNQPWASDSGGAPRLSISVSRHRRRLGPASDHAYRFVTYNVEPLLRRSRHHGCEEHEGGRCPGGPGRGSPRAGACPDFPSWLVRPRTHELVRLSYGRCRWMIQETGE
jgi:hypothetical protein